MLNYAQKLIRQRSANYHPCDTLLTLSCITYMTYDELGPAQCGTVQCCIPEQAHSVNYSRLSDKNPVL